MRYNYYNKKRTIGNPLVAAAAATGPAAPITALVSVAISALPGIIKFVADAFKHPVKDTRNRISQGKNIISNQDARTRLASIIAINDQNNQTMDVSIPEWLVWYRKNYSNDYQQLLPADMTYWNNYLNNVYNAYNIANFPSLIDLFNQAYFTQSEIDYSKQLSSPSTTKQAGMNIFATLAIVGAGLFLLLKPKKK